MKKAKPTRDYSQFFAICKREDFNYKAVVKEFTNGRTDSLSSLSNYEYKVMMLWLLRLNEPARAAFKNHNEVTIKEGNQMRRELIRIARLMHWGNGDLEQIKLELDAWCRKQKYKKGFMNHSPDEYALLVTIFRDRVYSNFLRDLHK